LLFFYLNEKNFIFSWYFAHLIVTLTLGRSYFRSKIQDINEKKIIFSWYFAHLIVTLHLL